MDNRRAFCALALATAVAATVRRIASAQSSNGQQQGQTRQDGGLRDRGAPTGRTGAATRGARSADGELTLDLVAPLRGVGLTSVDQPAIAYVLSGGTDRRPRLAISTPGQARPLANLELPRTPASGFGYVRLRDFGVRLAPDVLCVWSVTLALRPGEPSQDLVGSALIQYRPRDASADAANREPSLENRVAALARAGYWYDAVALAEQNRSNDRGAALASLLEREELRAAAGGAAGQAR